MKIYSEDYEELANANFYDYKDSSEWVFNQIPKGMQICGIKACTNKSEEFISRLGFILGSNPDT